MSYATPAIGAVVFHPKPGHPYRRVIGDPYEAYRLDDGKFLIESYRGYLTIGKLTGRTRTIYNIACPTIKRFEVETYADENGVILGRRGEKIAGTLAVRPDTIPSC